MNDSTKTQEMACAMFAREVGFGKSWGGVGETATQKYSSVWLLTVETACAQRVSGKYLPFSV